MIQERMYGDEVDHDQEVDHEEEQNNEPVVLQESNN
jgi:hypothetical protein